MAKEIKLDNWNYDKENHDGPVHLHYEDGSEVLIPKPEFDRAMKTIVEQPKDIVLAEYPCIWAEGSVVMLEDLDTGKEVPFEIIDVYEFRGVTCFALVEVLPGDEESDEVLIMQVHGEDEDDMELVMIEDEEWLQAAYDEFLSRDAE